MTIKPGPLEVDAILDWFTLEELVLMKLNRDMTSKMLAEEDGRLYEFVMDRCERPLIELAYLRFGRNQVRCAEALGINRNTFRKKLKRHTWAGSLPEIQTETTGGEACIPGH